MLSIAGGADRERHPHPTEDIFMSRVCTFVLVLILMMLVGCHGSQRSIMLTLEGPIYDISPYAEKPLKGKIEFHVELDER